MPKRREEADSLLSRIFETDETILKKKGKSFSSICKKTNVRKKESPSAVKIRKQG
jgi:hypothetical protein